MNIFVNILLVLLTLAFGVGAVWLNNEKDGENEEWKN